MNISEEGKRVFKRLCVIALASPTVFLAFVLIAHASFSPQRVGASSRSLNLTAAGLALAGLTIYLFFSALLYRRLWRLFPHIGDKEKGWSYAEGVFGLIGVGTMMPSVLGVLYYVIARDLLRGIILIALSYLLAVVEGVRFPGRIAEVEDALERMG